jgi:glycosidase
MSSPEKRIIHLLRFLYGDREGKRTWDQLRTLLDGFRGSAGRLAIQSAFRPGVLTEKDAILIVYADQITRPGENPLHTLAYFLESKTGNAFSSIHILPFFPYSSDDGFSVIDYHQVDPKLGNWEDLNRLSRSYRLMVDGVINHVSRQSEWFQSFLQDLPPYRDFFIAVDPGADLSGVVRPRALPPLTEVQTAMGQKWVWTTFSADQIDLNYSNPQVLLTILEILLFYVAQGVEIIRLDAIAYLWKEIGTPCIHLPQTHAVVKLIRAVLDAVAPGVLLITETNVPHQENISYFGKAIPRLNRTDEAQMVYQFSLAPLILHTFRTGSAEVLSTWVKQLKTPLPACAFFNFIASHDGIGVRPAEGILGRQEIEALVEQALAHGGQVSYKTNSDGSKSAYELNITLYDMLNDPAQPDLQLDVQRFLASQAIMLSTAGVPGIYFHSLIGARNCQSCYQRTGRARSINREKFTLPEILNRLDDLNGHESLIFLGYLHLLNQRRLSPAFHPQAEQHVLDIDKRVFALVRNHPGSRDLILCLVNVTSQTLDVNFKPDEWMIPHSMKWIDLISSNVYQLGDTRVSLELQPYQSMWLHNRLVPVVGSCHPARG